MSIYFVLGLTYFLSLLLSIHWYRRVRPDQKGLLVLLIPFVGFLIYIIIYIWNPPPTSPNELSNTDWGP